MEKIIITVQEGEGMEDALRDVLYYIQEGFLEGLEGVFEVIENEYE